MGARKVLVTVIVGAMLVSGCGYIVLPEDDQSQAPTSTKGWAGVVTSVGQSQSGSLRVELAIRNDTGYWSAMEATSGTASVKSSSGGSSRCDTVFVGTGGNRLAPGFQMRGYTGGSASKPVAQLLYVECSGASAAAGSTLSIDYTYVIGDYNFYERPKTYSAGLTVKLDQVATDLTYPVAEPVDGLIEKAGAKIDAINECTLTMVGAKRTETGLEFDWSTQNPTDYPVFVHIGIPPVIGSDGILYGFYQSPHLEDPPITLSKQSAAWTTKQTVPAADSGLYVLVSVESRQQKLFVSHVIDITDK